jgi:Fe-S-cluster containining protein
VGDSDALALEIETPMGAIRGMLRVPPKPMRLPELAMSFMGLSGKLTDQGVATVVREGRSISCAKGCGACCRQPVPLSPPEAWMIADLVAGLPEPRRAEVRTAFASADATFAAAGLKQPMLGDISSSQRMVMLALDYYRLGVACPFLVDEACSIHPWRPSICREYLVTSPASFCAAPGRGPVERVPVAVRLSEALSNLAARLLGRAPEVVPLVFALEWAEKNRADGLRAWDARELIEGLVGEIAAMGRSARAPLSPPG